MMNNRIKVCLRHIKQLSMKYDESEAIEISKINPIARLRAIYCLADVLQKEMGEEDG